jgi:anaerobic selenocysteine-containing dehydrogenase
MPKLDRRRFLQSSAALATGLAMGGTLTREKELFQLVDEAEGAEDKRKLVPTQCPYCGVGCHTYYVVENGKIVASIPDKDSPVNLGLQCIKGLTAAEALYVDRLDKVLIRKDMSNPLTGHVSKTKGRFDDSVFRVGTWEEGMEIISKMVVGVVKKFGGNSVGVYQSGQLTMEEQWLDNIFYKGVLQSNTIEANARMCMTSAVTGYIHSFGSDHPPGNYSDIEDADFINHWGHNARGAHPVLFWRVAATKEKRNIPTMVVDPRYTGTMDGYAQINQNNNLSITIRPNGDLSLQNAIAYLLMKEFPQTVDEAFIRKNTEGFEKYRQGIMSRYSPDQVIDRTGIAPAVVRRIASTWADATLKGRRRGKGGVLTFWGIGYNQSIHGQHRTINLINLHLLTGNMGRPGCGPFSMTGQPNAMSERLMGGLTGRLPFNEGIKNAPHRKLINAAWGLPAGRLDATAAAPNKGMAVGMFERALKGEVKIMQFAYATHVDMPEVETLIRPAITKTFTYMMEAYRHAPNLLYADVVLPAATHGEKWGVYQNSERRMYVTDKAMEPPKNCRPDMDAIIDEGKSIAKKLGLNAEKIFPYQRKADGYYDPQEVFRDICKASKGTDADLTGIIEVEKRDKVSPYEQLRKLKGIHYPAPTYEIAKKAGVARKYMNQEGWKDKPYGTFRRKNGRAKFKLTEQDYTRAKEILAKFDKVGKDPNFYVIDHYDVLVEMRDNGLTPEIPDFDYYGKPIAELKKADKYPLWLNLGVVFEHFHTTKTIRSATTRRLVPEQYVEMNPRDARQLGVEDGEWVRIVTPRGSYEARASIGTKSKVKPARNKVMPGQIFSPWNLSVADSADPKKNKWLVNAVAHRAFDPVSGQADFKHLKARIEKI